MYKVERRAGGGARGGMKLVTVGEVNQVHTYIAFCAALKPDHPVKSSWAADACFGLSSSCQQAVRLRWWVVGQSIAQVLLCLCHCPPCCCHSYMHPPAQGDRQVSACLTLLDSHDPAGPPTPRFAHPPLLIPFNTHVPGHPVHNHLSFLVSPEQIY